MKATTKNFGFTFEKESQKTALEVKKIQTVLQKRFGSQGVSTSLRFAKVWSTL